MYQANDNLNLGDMKELITNVQHHYLKLQSSGIIRFATPSEIVYLKADDNYTCFVLSDLSQFIVCKTLQNFETILGHPFFRCHKSYLINSSYIKEMNKRNHHLLLTNGEIVPFSRTRTKMLEEKMKLKTSLIYDL